jgi:hypothetical protein
LGQLTGKCVAHQFELSHTVVMQKIEQREVTSTLSSGNGSDLKTDDNNRRKETQVSAGEQIPDSEALAKLIGIFEQVSEESRERIFHTLGTYLGFGQSRLSERPSRHIAQIDAGGKLAGFTEDRSLSAKEFLLQKQPHTDVERVACLAYYLTHYLNTPHFKTVDISRANTEAAQIKFSNPAFAVVNATNQGYLTQAGKGFKQISALGEQFVAALPDRDAAKAVMATFRRRRAPKKDKGSVTRGQ